MDTDAAYLPKPLEEIPAHTGDDHAADEYDSDHGGYSLRTLLSWSASGRPFQKKGREYFLNIFVITLLFQVILFLFSQYVLMALVFALAFLAYALNSVPPHMFQYKITTEGIMIEDHFFLWQELYDFYMKRQNGEDVIIISTKSFFPGELTIVLGDMHRDHVRDVLLDYLPYREYVKPTFTEKSGDWLAKNFPLEKTFSHSKKL
jgi:hypothetical protein